MTLLQQVVIFGSLEAQYVVSLRCSSHQDATTDSKKKLLTSVIFIAELISVYGTISNKMSVGSALNELGTPQGARVLSISRLDVWLSE